MSALPATTVDKSFVAVVLCCVVAAPGGVAITKHVVTLKAVHKSATEMRKTNVKLPTEK